MISKNLYYKLALKVIVITITAVIMALFYAQDKIVFALFSLLFIGFQTWALIKYLNQTNEKIAYFFKSIKNEDFTLRFPEHGNIKTLNELHVSLNMLNSIMQNVHLKNEAQEKYYQEIIKQANIGILTLNAKGHILFANPMMEKLLNYKPLNHINQLSQVNTELHELFVKIQPFETKLFQFSNEREKIQLSIKSTAIVLDKEELLLVVAQDIHKELDKKETDSWIRLIRVLTHEIMNTITPITSISESILKFFKVGGSTRQIEELTEGQVKSTIKGLDVIKEQGENLMDFVQSYRTFLSVPTPDKEPVSVQHLFKKVKSLLDITNAKINFEVTVEPNDLELFVDEKLINQVLINLVKNAFQSIENKESGSVKLIASITNDNKKIIQVIDNGSGIPPEILNEIFIPFFTTKNDGTGIGLSLSKHIMRLHGGTINVISGEETVFTLIF